MPVRIEKIKLRNWQKIRRLKSVLIGGACFIMSAVARQNLLILCGPQYWQEKMRKYLLMKLN